jgi:nicotinamidase-related amidase
MSQSATAAEFHASALITIDTQRDFLDDGGSPIPGTSAALPAMRHLVEAFREAARPIVHIVRIYEHDGSNAERCRRELLAGGAQLVVRNSNGSQLARELQPDPEARLSAALLLSGQPQTLGPREVAIFKPRWGVFYRTTLEQQLRQACVSTLVFCGCNFPNCPRTSIYEASERDFRVVVARDALSGLYDRGEDELLSIGVEFATAAQVAAALSALPCRPATARNELDLTRTP